MINFRESVRAKGWRMLQKMSFRQS